MTTTSTTPATAPIILSNVPRCLWAIVGMPVALLVLSWLLGIVTIPTASTKRGIVKWWRKRQRGRRQRQHEQQQEEERFIDFHRHGWQWRLLREILYGYWYGIEDDDNNNNNNMGDENDGHEIDEDEYKDGGIMTSRQRASYVQLLSAIVGQVLVTGAFMIIWRDVEDVRGQQQQQQMQAQQQQQEKQEVDINPSNSPNGSITGQSWWWWWGWDRDSSSFGVRTIVTLVVAATYLRLFVRHTFWISVVGVPVLFLASIYFVVVHKLCHILDDDRMGTRTTSSSTVRSTVHNWAVREQYLKSQVSDDPEELSIRVPWLVHVAVLVDATTWGLLIPALLVTAYWKLFSVSQILQSYRRRRRKLVTSGREKHLDREMEDTSSWWERVYRMYSRYHTSLTDGADEYCLHNPSRADASMAVRVFRRLIKAQTEYTNVAVWIGTDLCVCNFTPPVPEPHPRTGRVQSALLLEPIVHATFSRPSMPIVRLYGTSASLTDFRSSGGGGGGDVEARAAIVTAMDAFFRLLGLYERGRRGDDGSTRLLELIRDENYRGAFPVSRNGWRSLVREIGRSSGSCAVGRPTTPPSLNFHRLGLTIDQWEELLQACREGPNVQFWWYGSDHATHPEEFQALVNVVRDDRCAARINALSVDELPPHVLEALATALERNRSVTELNIGISSDVSVRGGEVNNHHRRHHGDRRETTQFDVNDSAAFRILQALSRRQSPLDWLEIHVSVFTPRTWNLLWNEVVPSTALYLKCLKVCTGIGPDLVTQLPADAVNEEEMIQFVCRNRSLCSFEFVNVNVSTTSNAATTESIDEAVRFYLEFNRFRRLLWSVDGIQDDDAKRSRWVGTLLIRSVESQNPSWCYYQLRRHAVTSVGDGRWWIDALRLVVGGEVRVAGRKTSPSERRPWGDGEAVT